MSDRINERVLPAGAMWPEALILLLSMIIYAPLFLLDMIFDLDWVC